MAGDLFPLPVVDTTMPPIDWTGQPAIVPADALSLVAPSAALHLAVDSGEGHREALHSALDMLHQQHREIERLRQRCTTLINENRTLRQCIAEGASAMPADNQHSTAVVALKGGLTVPEAAVRFALDLETRGITLRLDGNELVVRTNDDGISVEDEARIRAHVIDLKRLVAYCDVMGPQ